MDTLRFFFVTWNVATKSPGQDLNSLLDFPSQFNKNKPLPDFFVIGLQEVKSQPQNLLMDSLFSDSWTSSFNKILCRQGFVIAKSIRLQGLVLLVYTQMKHLTHLRDIEAQYTKTGLGGMWGNKGAVSVRFSIYGCSISLVNSHLTAHDHLLADRINDYNTIIKQHQYHVSETSNILYHDYVFWIGDLNFRMDHPPGAGLSSEEIVNRINKVEKDKYAGLIKHDQLHAVMESGEAFSEFKEPELKFPPTYKFNIGTDEYDIKRKPSWTDRILYKVIANNYENITLRADLISYNHIPHYTISDHKPVVAQYNIKTRQSFTRVVTELPKVGRANMRMRSAIVMALPSTPESGIPDGGAPDGGAPDGGAPDGGAPDGGAPDVGAPNGGASDVRTPEALLGNLAHKVPNSDDIATSIADAMVEEVLQTFSNYTEKTVEFAPISRIWYIGDADFRTQCTLSPDVQINPNDWIGIYDANFQSLDDYIVYDYLAKVCLPEAPTPVGQPRVITLSFPVGSGVRTPGFYRFIYFSQPNNDVRSVLGISDPFEVSSKEDQLVSIDPCLEASTSAKVKPSTATSDIFTDFTDLDVTKLSRHFSNDLSID